MEKEYLTIKEVAEKADVSYQAVYKRLNSTLKDYVVEVKGRKMLRPEVLSEFNNPKKSTVKKENQPSFNVNSTSSSSNYEEEYQRINKRNEDIIDDLREQLKEKDEQIKKQSDHIIDLSNKIAELFDNNQKLQLNYQMLLSDGENDTEIIEVDPGVARQDEKPQEIKKEKKGLFRRLFKSDQR